ncbi:MAG: hypothetical protein V3R83_11920 [Gammaproteobacteria bacterium]
MFGSAWSEALDVPGMDVRSLFSAVIQWRLAASMGTPPVGIAI